MIWNMIDFQQRISECVPICSPQGIMLNHTICKVRKNMRTDREGVAHRRGPISTQKAKWRSKHGSKEGARRMIILSKG